MYKMRYYFSCCGNVTFRKYFYSCIYRTVCYSNFKATVQGKTNLVILCNFYIAVSQSKVH